MNQEKEAKWEKLAREAFSGMKEWRIQNPRATFAEIEDAIDNRVDMMRAKMLEDVALASEAADVATANKEARARCTICGKPLQDRGKRKRHLTTQGNQHIELERSYGYCSTCRVGFFPPG